MADPLTIAGAAVSGIGLFTDLVKTYKDFRSWEEKDLAVDSEWLAGAIEDGKLEGQESDYAWATYFRVPTLEMKKTHEQVAAYDKKKRLRYRVVRGAPDSRIVLMKKIS